MSDLRFCGGPGGVSSLGLRVVWCSIYRRWVLGERVATALSGLLDGVDNGWEMVARELIPDPVHMVGVRPAVSPAGVARRFKGRASRMLRAEFPWLGPPRLLWSKSYFAA